MKPFPKLALVAALAGAGGLAMSAPALAKKDDKPADANASPALKLSPDVRQQASAAQAAIQAGNVATAEPAVTAAQAAAKTDDDKYVSSVLRLQLEGLKMRNAPAGQRTDDTALKAPLEALISNPRTPPASRPQYAYQRGAIAFDANQYADAIRFFEQARQLGYNDPQLGLQLVKAKYDTGDLAGGNAEVESVIKAADVSGRKADEQIYRYALAQNYKKGDKRATMLWLQRWISAYPSAKNWHDVLTIYGLQQGALATLDRAQTVDLLRLMRATHSLDQFGYEDYADKALKLGLPDEAKTVLAEGKATGKVPASSANATALTAQASRGVATEGPLAGLEVRAKAAPTGALAQQTADAYLGQGNYAKAIALYQVALTKGGVKTEEVNMHLGIAMALSGDKAGAKTAFGAVTTVPNADIAQFWVMSLDHPIAT